MSASLIRSKAKMRRSTKLFSAVAIGLAIWATVWIARFDSTFPDCGREEIGRASNDRRTIIIESINCGATTALATHVSIVEDSDITTVHRVATFSHPGIVTAVWDSKSKITISYDEAMEAFQKDQRYSDIEIDYSQTAPTDNR